MEETMTSGRSAKLPLFVLAGALVLAVIAAFTFYFNWRETEEQLHAARLDNAAYEKDSFRVSNLIKKNKDDRETLASDAYKTVVLRGTAKSPSSLALAYYDPSTRKLLIDVRRLPEAPVGLQYQLWAMDGAKATDAGTIRPEKLNEGLLEMNPVSGVKSLVLTVEKAGGAPAPTTSETYLSGTL